MKNFIGKKVIDFTLPAVLSDGSIIKDFNLYRNIDRKYALLFFYPMDFTFVCPSELIALNNRLDKFKNKGIEVIAISIDSQFVHNAWRKTSTKSGGLGDIGYTLVSDIKKQTISSYGLLDEESGVSFRGSLFIDKSKTIRLYHIHDFPIGRNIDECIRLFDALDFHSNHGNVCQAGWTKGDSGIVPSSDGVSKFLSTKAKDL